MRHRHRRRRIGKRKGSSMDNFARQSLQKNLGPFHRVYHFIQRHCHSVRNRLPRQHKHFLVRHSHRHRSRHRRRAQFFHGLHRQRRKPHSKPQKNHRSIFKKLVHHRFHFHSSPELYHKKQHQIQQTHQNQPIAKIISIAQTHETPSNDANEQQGKREQNNEVFF